MNGDLTPLARRASLSCYRALLRLIPAEDRGRDGDELEAAFLECLRREKQQHGGAGFAVAWAGIVADTLRAAVALRLDERQRRRVHALGARPSQGDPLMSNLWQDVRYTLRVLRRAPGFTAAIILTLGLAIGASTSVFSVVNAVLLRSLPFTDPERLVLVYEGIPKALSGPIGFSAPDFKAFEQRTRSFAGIAAYGAQDFELSSIQQPERVKAARVSASVFEVLGVSPSIGSAFTIEDDEGRRPVAILSDGLWRRAFGADPSIVGRAVLLDRRPYTVLGVMPRTFVFPHRGPALNNVPADLFIPISFSNRELTGFGSMYNNSVVARLKPGVTIQQADAEVRAIATNLVAEIYPAPMRDGGFALSASAVSLRDETVGGVERLLYILLAAIAVVLLIACADVANLMLTRAVARGREIAVRSALGADRRQLARQVLVESGMLSLAGGALGIAVAYWASAAIVRLAPPTIPRLHELSIDVRVLAFALAISLTTALLCGLLPALELSRRPSGDLLKDGSRGSTTGGHQRRLFGALVIVQFALAIVLLVAGGLLVRSFTQLMSVDPGFRPERVLTLATSLPPSAYVRGRNVRSFYEDLVARVERLPGIGAAAVATDLPLSTRERRAFTIEAQPPTSADRPHVIAHDWVIGSYFQALGVGLKRGRFLSPRDTAASERVIVINETMAKQFWPGLDPVGQRMAWGGAADHGPWLRIVGVVGDVKQGPLGTATIAQSYQPWVQVVPDDVSADGMFGAMRSLTLIVRTNGDPLSTSAAIQGTVRAIDPSLPIAQVKPMNAVVRESAAPQRFNTVLLGGFAGVALALAAIGIAGVLATMVSRRTQEIGVRMALGAARADVLRMVIRQGMTLVVLGLGIGLPVALLVTRYMTSLLFNTGPRDIPTFAAAIALLLLVAFVACYLPARRATRVDPMVALRWE
jgi:putative ABC transport system permease protein